MTSTIPAGLGGQCTVARELAPRLPSGNRTSSRAVNAPSLARRMYSGKSSTWLIGLCRCDPALAQKRKR